MKVNIIEAETKIGNNRRVSIFKSNEKNKKYLVILEFINKKDEVYFARVLAEFKP